MGGRERRTQRKPIKCGHKKDTALQVLVLWYGTAGRQADTDRMWVFWEITRSGIHQEY